MLALSSSLIRRSVPGLTENVARPDGVKGWLVAGSFRPDWDGSEDTFWLRDITLSEFSQFLCFDYQRFALSSWETLCVAKSEFSNSGSLSWPLLSAYYSAFFAAHAIIRACGRSVTRIDGPIVNSLKEIFSLYSIDVRAVSSGDFALQMIQTDDRKIDVQFTRLEKKSGGVHDQFWKYFYKFLESVSEEVVSKSEPEALETIGIIEDIRKLLSIGNAGSGNWLSMTRNKINYQHGFDVWFPVSGGRAASDSLGTLKPIASEAIRLDIDARKKELAAFVATNHFLAAVNCDIADSFSQKDASPMKFGGKWRRIRDRFSL